MKKVSLSFEDSKSYEMSDRREIAMKMTIPWAFSPSRADPPILGTNFAWPHQGSLHFFELALLVRKHVRLSFVHL